MALSSSIGRLWKTSELDLLSSDRDLRFLGCEISASEDGHVFYIHQWPYIEEILRHHEVPSTTLSYVQAPREMVNFEAFEDEGARDRSSGEGRAAAVWRTSMVGSAVKTGHQLRCQCYGITAITCSGKVQRDWDEIVGLSPADQAPGIGNEGYLR